jgi:hypothetical protein
MQIFWDDLNLSHCVNIEGWRKAADWYYSTLDALRSGDCHARSTMTVS